jgi:hypothetical protein
MSSDSRYALRITATGLITSALAWLITTANAAAQQDPDHLVVTVYSGSRGSEELLSGHYEAALAQLETSRGLDDQAGRFDTATNLCVAQMMAGQFESARRACDAAVKTAMFTAIDTRTWGPPAGGARQSDVAIAYANRAVLHWLTDDTRSAASDMAQAKRFAPKADFVAHNVAALNATVEPDARIRLAK